MTMNRYLKSIAQPSGQTLLEVMIALFVLTSGFLGILSLLSQSIFLSKTIGNQAIATYLASEGIETAKNLIDRDVYENLAGAGGGWGACFNGNVDFELDYTTTNCAAMHSFGDPDSADYLYFDPTTNTYFYSFDGAGGSPSIFKREVKVVQNPANPDEITVQSIVYWNVGTVSQQSISLEDDFYDWYPHS